MTIRRATISDVATLVELNRSTQAMHATALPDIFRPDPPEEVVASAFRSAIEAPSSLWLIAEEGKACGYLSADFREVPESWCHVRYQVCYIAAIAVDPEFRRKGIARALLSRLKSDAEGR
jgi:ribosomal protein S18 acetylase RimI-like enzyme